MNELVPLFSSLPSAIQRYFLLSGHMSKRGINMMSCYPSLDKSKILSILHEITPDLQKRYRVRRMGLFGSYAMDNANESSDIDILVEFEPGADIWDLSGLKMELESVFLKSVDVSTVNSLKPDMKEAILSKVAYS